MKRPCLGGNSIIKMLQCLKDESMLRYRNCNHQSAPNFFLQSINTTECLFWSVHCDSYDDFFIQCPPDTSAMNLMGLPAKKIDGLSPKSNFYLRTGSQFPYYLKNGYELPI
ncbi:hypothetical protein CEXT_327401 [Caerostris extrusa]|uniref:Lipase domain-containing protein n=1 Tax=Caerostris extrusa TaxID=172846 RepID=A0AAV4PHF6_CAEEX|nr:hypothetical protein CEXT_327401 [Caerostris extrusa]